MSDSDEAAHQWCMVIDLRPCDGCEKCVEACHETHYLSEDQEWIKVYERTNASGETYFMPRLCMHCANPPCVRVCPVGATFRDEEGVVLVDQNVCIGCRTCMAACPYEARYFNWSEPPPAPSTLQQTMPEFPVPQQKGTVGKCILCVHNTDIGKLPACVEACTMEALYIGDLKADVATNGTDTVKLSKFLRENNAIRYKARHRRAAQQAPGQRRVASTPVRYTIDVQIMFWERRHLAGRDAGAPTQNLFLNTYSTQLELAARPTTSARTSHNHLRHPDSSPSPSSPTRC